MKLTKEECIRALKWFKLKQCGGCENKYPNCWSKCIETPYTTLSQLINEHFESSECRVESSLTREKNLVSNLVSEIDKLDKTLEEVREQCASAMNEVQALRNENEMLKRRNVGLEQTISNQNKKLHSYYMAMVTNKE